MTTDKTPSDAPLDSLALMKVVMQADEALLGRCTRGTTNWAAAIGKAVQDAVLAARAPADSVQEDAARWHWMAEYIVGTRTDLDDELIASATVDELRKLVDADLATRKQGEKQ